MSAKKILFPLFSLFLIYQSWNLCMQLMKQAPDNINIWEGLIYAWLLTLFITGIFAITGFAYPTSHLLGESYYRVDDPERLKKYYRWLGVKYFRTFLMIFFWGREKNRKKYFDGSREGLENLDYQSRQSEFGHLAALVIIDIVCVLFLIKGHWWLLIFCILFNLFGNFYPVILQRMHRARIQRIQSNYELEIDNWELNMHSN